jgi:cephalosporin hydroxylase
MKNIKTKISQHVPRRLLNVYGSTKRYFLKQFAPASEKVHVDMATIHHGVFNITYRGIPTLRCPFDYVIYQMILMDLKPDLVIEIGTNYGGTTLYLADLMDTLGHGLIHSIDLETKAPDIVKNHPRVTLFDFGWQGYDVKNISSLNTVLVIDDGSHMYEDVIGALQKFSPSVSAGSYYIVEDGIIDELGQRKQYSGGPLKAIREFLPSHPEYVVDRQYCDMFGKNATFNVNGYLRKI